MRVTTADDEGLPAVILAGGAGRRLGGDKAGVLLAGEPLIAHVRHRLSGQVGTLAVNAADPAPFAGTGLAVIGDPMPGKGPLSGILAALDWAAGQGADRVLTVAVDTPFLPADLVARLAGARAPAAYAETADGPQATTGLWSVDLRDGLDRALAAGTRKVRDWTDAIGAPPVHFPDVAAFLNVNTPDDLARAEAHLASRRFDTVLMVDWSARAAPSPAKPTADAIFVGMVRDGHPARPTYQRTRSAAMRYLTGLLDGELRAGRRVLVGFDFPFGYPAGFARAVTGADDPLALWADLARRIADDDRNANNRFDVAEDLNARFPGIGPFWGCPPARASATLPAQGRLRIGHGFAERRRVEDRLRRAQPVWKLFTTGSVGSQALLGLPRLQALRDRYGDALSVSPFQAPDTPIVLAEIYPGLIDTAIKARVRPGEILDAVQVDLMARALAALPAGHLDAMLREGDREEGWILGLGHEDALLAALP